MVIPLAASSGMVSRANLEILAKGGGRYIVCMPITPGGEVEREVMRRPGRFKKVADNLEVKEVVVGEGERRRRYVVCFNPDEAKRQQQHRAKVLNELGAELESLRHQPGEGHSKRVCALRASRRYGRYLRLSKTGKPEIDQAEVKTVARLDGKFVVHSNDDTLSAEDMALGSKQLQRVEDAWRTLNSGLRLRPIYHFAPHRIHAHVALTVFALLREWMAEQACNDTWRNIRDDLKPDKTCAIVEPQRYGPAGHRTNTNRCQTIEITPDQQAAAAPRCPINATSMSNLDDACKALLCLDES